MNERPRESEETTTMSWDTTESIRPCKICGEDVETRDVRKETFCYNCNMIKEGLSRYGNSGHAPGPDEKRRMYESRTVAYGPFNYKTSKNSKFQ